MYLKPVLLSLSLLAALHAAAQNKKDDRPAKPQSAALSYVERMPIPRVNINEYLGANLHYPDSAIARNIEGRIVVKFVVNEDGRTSDCTVVKGIGWGCDEEALRVVRSMPAWTPGTQDGKPVKVYYTIPITFKLEDDVPGPGVNNHQKQ